MEAWPLIVLLVLGVPICLVIWLIARAINARLRIEELTRRLAELELEVFLMKKEASRPRGAPASAAPIQPAEPPVASPLEQAPVIPPPPPETFPAQVPEPTVTFAPLPPEHAAPIRVALPPRLTVAPPPIPPPILYAHRGFENAPRQAAMEETVPPATEDFEPAPPPPAPEKGSFEMRLGTYWLVRVGIVVILTSLVFAANLAYHKVIPKLGPGGKVSLLYLASGLLLGAGAWWQRRPVKESLRNYGQVLFAGGLAAVYFTTYVAHHIPQLRVIENAMHDGALLLAWAGFIAWIADRRKSEVLALFAVVLAYYTSVITQVGAFTLYSNLVLTLLAVFFLVRNRWATLSFVSLVATYAGYAFWRFFHGGEWRWATPEEGLWFGAYFLMSYWVAFTAAVFLSRHEKLADGNRATFLTFNNGAFFTLFLLTMLQVQMGGFWKFSLIYGIVLLALNGLSGRMFADEPIVKNSYLTQGLLLVTIGLISKYSGAQLALILAAESVVLLVLGTQRKSLILQGGAYLAAMMSVGWGFDGLEKFDRHGLYMGMAVGALMVFNAFWFGRSDSSGRNNTLRPTPSYFTLLALAIWAMATWQNVLPENLPLVFGIEAILLTLSVCVLDVPELALLGQGYVLLAQFALLSQRVEAGPGHASQLAALRLGLATAAESALLLVLGTRRQSLGLQIGAYIAGALGIGCGIVGLEQYDRFGLYAGVVLGAIMVFNAYWSRRSDPSDNDSALHAVPAFYTVLALAIWISTTWFNTSQANFPLVLAVEALLLTLVIYVLRVPEIPLLGQGCLLLAQLAWQVHVVSDAPALPWWNPLLMIAITLGLSRWLQLQKTISVRAEVTAGWQFGYALGIVALLFSWLHPKVDAPTWLMVVGLLSLAVTAYGVTTRLWLLAACGQILVLLGVAEFVIQLCEGKPAWHLPLTPIAVLGLLSFSTVKWFEVNSAGENRARQPLLLIALFYRWVALVMSAWWICEYIPERERIWVFMALGVLIFLFAGLRKSAEAVLFGAGFTLMSFALLWLTPDLQMRIYVPNLLALLAFLGQQRIARRVSGRYTLLESIHNAVIIIGCLSLWRYLSCWVSLASKEGVYLTVSWSVLALVLFGCGMVLRERMYRWTGLGVLAGALGRVVVIDVWKQETIYRVLTFMALGVVLLVLGFIYNKYQDTIRKWL